MKCRETSEVGEGEGGRNGTSRPRALHWMLCLGSSLLLGVWAIGQSSAGPTQAKTEAAAVVAAVKAQLLTNAACPIEPGAIQEAAASLSIILNPELVQREARKDPAAVQAEALAAASFFSPSALHVKRMENPEYRRSYTAAMESFRHQAQQVETQILPSATTTKEIQSVLNNPAWRRQREESLRAVMPAAPPLSGR